MEWWDKSDEICYYIDLWNDLSGRKMFILFFPFHHENECKKESDIIDSIENMKDWQKVFIKISRLWWDSNKANWMNGEKKCLFSSFVVYSIFQFNTCSNLLRLKKVFIRLHLTMFGKLSMPKRFDEKSTIQTCKHSSWRMKFHGKIEMTKINTSREDGEKQKKNVHFITYF